MSGAADAGHLLVLTAAHCPGGRCGHSRKGGHLTVPAPARSDAGRHLLPSSFFICSISAL